MKILISNIFRRKPIETNFDDNLDSFADHLAIELKQVASDSIITELKKIEKKYLSRILKNSHVPILSITFIPQDRNTAMQCDEFMRIHSEVDGNFKENFLKQILQSEYRTVNNCKALLSENFSVNFQLEKISTDQPTGDEEFQISLRGKRIRFSAIVEFAQLKADSISENIKDQQSCFNTLQNSVENPRLDTSSSSELISQVEIIIDDSQPSRTQIVDLPCLIGRESSTPAKSLATKIDIYGTYISRSQLYIFSLDKKVYAFIPEEASLLAEVNESIVLQKLSLILIDQEVKSFRFGHTNEHKVKFDASTSYGDYPLIKLKITSFVKNYHPQTPLPNLRT
jgi:hypothetical protein